MKLFQKDEAGNWMQLWRPTAKAALAIAEVYNTETKSTIVKEGTKTSYDKKDLLLWLEFCKANEILLDESAKQSLLCYRLILVENTQFVEDGDLDTLIPMGKVLIDPETYLRIMTNWLFQRQQHQETYIGKRELAEWLDVSVPTVDRLLKEGCPSKKIRSRRVFNKAAVNHWLKS